MTRDLVVKWVAEQGPERWTTRLEALKGEARKALNVEQNVTRLAAVT